MGTLKACDPHGGEEDVQLRGGHEEQSEAEEAGSFQGLQRESQDQ